MKHRLSAGALALMSAIVLIQVTMGGVGTGQATGQLTNVGGNKLTPTCERDPKTEVGINDTLGPPTAGIGSNVFRSSPGMTGLAADLRGGLYLAYSGYILDRTSIIAGKKVTGAQGELEGEGPGRQTAFPNVVGLAALPSGGSLWVLQEAPQGIVVNPPPGKVRHIQLGGDNVVTTVAETGPRPTAIAADGTGSVYVTEQSGAVYKIDPAGRRTAFGTIPGGANGIAVDLMGSEIFVSGPSAVYRLTGSSSEVVAGSAVQPLDGSRADMTPTGLAIGHDFDAPVPAARYLYIADTAGGRIVRVDLKQNPRVVTTVAGGGKSFVSQSTTDAKSAALFTKFVAADTSGVYMTSSDQCTVFHLTTPAAFRLTPDLTTPPGGTTDTTLPPGGGQTKDNTDTVAGTVGNNQTDTGTVTQQNPVNDTQPVPGTQTQVQPQPQTELRVIDQGNPLTTPSQAGQTTVEPVPTPAGSAQVTPAPTPAPTPISTPTPDAGTVTLVDPGPSTAAAVVDPSTASPVAPAPAPVPPPPAPASAPPPAAQQPVSNVGLAHGDSPTPAKGAARYAMVRNDEEQSVAALAMAGAGAMVAMFLCALFVAPGASSKPKPRPKGAY